MPIDELIPSEQQIYEWIQEVFGHGVRRPGYPADRWAESHCLGRFRALGLENVRHEPVELPCWEPRSASLRITAGGRTLDVPCFALPHSRPKAGIEAQLVALKPGAPERVNARNRPHPLP